MISNRIANLEAKYLRYKNRLDRYPACFDHHECVFFHIPKAAGTSVCMSLFGYQVGHLTFKSLYDSNPEKATKYFKFTFVRNPWARLVSAYHFLMAGGMNDEDKKWKDETLVNYDGFKSFVMNWLNEDSIHSQVHFIPQYEFLIDDNGVMKADFVGKTENINKDYQKVLDMLGIESSLSFNNQSNHDIYTEYYDEQTKDIVSSLYKKDIELFGYKYGE